MRDAGLARALHLIAYLDTVALWSLRSSCAPVVHRICSTSVYCLADTGDRRGEVEARLVDLPLEVRRVSEQLGF